MKSVTKKVPLFPNSAEKDTLISDLSLTQKKAPFSENFRTHMLTYFVKVDPPGNEYYPGLTWIDKEAFAKQISFASLRQHTPDEENTAFLQQEPLMVISGH